MEPKTCMITGHRPSRFKFKYNEDYKLCIKLKKVLVAQLTAQYENGVRTFWVGGAIGVDTWAAEAILQMKQQPEYADLQLYVAVPFPGQDDAFDPKQKRRYRAILAGCDKSITVCPAYAPGAYQKRNAYMVAHCDCVLAVYDSEKALRSGTGQTANMAIKKGLPVTLIHPDTLEVTDATKDYQHNR